MELIAITAFLTLFNSSTVAASSYAIDAVRGEQEGVVSIEEVVENTSQPGSLFEALTGSGQ